MHPDVELTVRQLLAMGVLSTEGCTRFADLVRSLQTLPFGDTENPSVEPTGQSKRASRTQKRARKTRTPFTIGKTELKRLYQKQPASAIAKAHGVSISTVNNRLREWGIKKETGRKSATKKRKKSA